MNSEAGNRKRTAGEQGLADGNSPARPCWVRSYLTRALMRGGWSFRLFLAKKKSQIRN